MYKERYQKKYDIIYIMGGGRSGSTLFSLLLGMHSNIISVGEIKSWGKYKGCPRDINIDKRSKKLWEMVKKEYEIQIDEKIAFKKIEKIVQKYESKKEFLRKIFKGKKTTEYDYYMEHLINLYCSIHNATSKKIIVDSSKNLSRALHLLKCNELNVKIIHLIRDPRGVVWSFMKKNVEQKAKRPLKAIWDYICINLICYILRLIYKEKIIKIVYEDLVYAQTKTLYKLSKFIKINFCELDDIIKKNDDISVKYLIDGNRIRKNRTIKIKIDDEWKYKLAFKYKKIAALFGKPIYYL